MAFTNRYQQAYSWHTYGGIQYFPFCFRCHLS